MLGRVQRDQHLLHGLLAASSLTDRLTGLYNYGTFVDYLHNEITKADRYGGELTLIMFDLDHFKRFNDRHGHEAGNDLLRRVGATLQSVVREADMAARYGGEEFALLISGDAQDGLELAERVRRAIETTALDLRGGEVVYVTASAGVAAYGLGSHDETLLDRAGRQGAVRVEASRPQPGDGAPQRRAARAPRGHAVRLTPARRCSGRRAPVRGGHRGARCAVADR